MGKSTAAGFLSGMGFPVADTDLIAREVVAPGQPAIAEIRAAFGDVMIQADGHLDRARLAEVVFGDAEERRRLEAIVHPRIRSAWEGRVAAWREAGHALGLVVIPLLFETQAANRFDATVCVACSEATQGHRLKARGWTGDHIRQRVAAQWPIEQKIEQSTYVVWTEPPPAIHEAQLRHIVRLLGVPLAPEPSSVGP